MKATFLIIASLVLLWVVPLANAQSESNPTSSSDFATSGILATESNAPTDNHGVSCPSSGLTNYRGELNADLDDYGVIFQDALPGSGCAPTAAVSLFAKVNATLQAPPHQDGTLHKVVGPYQGWLEGAHVSLIFSTALLLAPQNQLAQALALSVAQVRGQYLALAPGRSISAFAALDPACGFDNGNWLNGNTCMDDYSVAASAFAWIAAYENKRGEPDPSIVGLATHTINQALTGEELTGNGTHTGGASVCIYVKGRHLDPSRGFCNGVIAELNSRVGELVSLNHKQQNPGGYGLGLMSVISSSIVGLQIANNIAGLTINPISNMSADEQTVLYYLFNEAQTKLETIAKDKTKITELESPRFQAVAQTAGCYGISGSSLVVNQANCWDGFGEDAIFYPQMFPVKEVYNVFGIEAPSGYQFDISDRTIFTNSLLVPNLGNGRLELFVDVGYNWYFSRPALSASIPYEGYHEVATCHTISGWAWESNQPNTPILVDIYDGGTPVAYSWPANLFRQDLLSAGKGNGYHAFVFPFYPQTKGQHTVTVKYSGTQIGLGWTPRTFTCP